MTKAIQKTLFHMNGKANLAIDHIDYELVLFKEYTAVLTQKASAANVKGFFALFLHGQQFDVPASAFQEKIGMVGILRWKTRTWEDDFHQVAGGFQMFFASEVGGFKYEDKSTDKANVVIYDV